MATSKKFSELPAASSVGNGDLFAIAHEDALAETGYVSQKLTAAQAGQKVNGDTEYPTSLPSFPANGQNPFAALEKLNQDIIDLYPVNTASGSIATFSTSLALPLVAMSAEIVAQQASGTPTPSTPLPISGFDSVNLTRCGKNLFKNLLESQTCNGVIYTVNSDGSITLGGQATSEAIRTFHFYLPAGSYIYTSGITEDYATYDTYITKGGSTIARGREGSNTFTLTEYSDLIFGIRVRNGVSPNITIKPMIRVSTDTDSTFVAYDDDTFTISLGQTVYGGVLDAINGKLTITHGMSILDGSDENWGLASDGTANRRFVLYGLPAFKNGSTSIANYLVYVTGTSHDFGTYSLGKSEQYGYYIVLHDKSSNFASTDALKSYLEEHNLELVYELATPVEITGLTGVNFTTIAGEQNIFADCGDISVSFKQGIQEYIDSKIAETQALIL